MLVALANLNDATTTVRHFDPIAPFGPGYASTAGNY